VTYIGVALSAIGVGALADAVAFELAIYAFSGAVAVAALATVQLARRVLSPS
jgi:hypothetical protein